MRLWPPFENERAPGVSNHIVGKKLQSDKATKFRVLSFVNNTHPAASKLFDDAVVRKGLPDERVGIRRNAAILVATVGKSTNGTHPAKWDQFTGEELQVTFSGDFS